MSSATHSPGFVVMLASRHEVAVRTLAFEVNRPLNFQFKAGQTADLTWIDPPETDGEGNTRTLSIASAPHEPQLLFAMRLRDTAFKRVLEKTALGTAIRMEGPFGNLTLHNNASRPAVLLAGGIGITPFRSIVRPAAHEKLPHKILLFCANTSPAAHEAFERCLITGVLRGRSNLLRCRPSRYGRGGSNSAEQCRNRR